MPQPGVQQPLPKALQPHVLSTAWMQWPSTTSHWAFNLGNSHSQPKLDPKTSENLSSHTSFIFGPVTPNNLWRVARPLFPVARFRLSPEPSDNVPQFRGHTSGPVMPCRAPRASQQPPKYDFQVKLASGTMDQLRTCWPGLQRCPGGPIASLTRAKGVPTE